MAKIMMIKLPSFVALIILSLILAYAASRCIYMGEKLENFPGSASSLAEKKGALVSEIEAGEISITKEQLVSYLVAAERVEQETYKFIDKQSKAWNKLGIILGFIAVAQAILTIAIFVGAKQTASNKT